MFVYGEGSCARAVYHHTCFIPGFSAQILLFIIEDGKARSNFVHLQLSLRESQK